MLEQEKERKISTVKHTGSKADPIRGNIEASKHRNIEASSRIVSRYKQSRSFRSHPFLSEWKTSWLPSRFSRIRHWTMLLRAQNIQIDSYIHTRGRTSMDFAFPAIVNDFEALAASWF